jgi:hypothetical protein
MDTLCVIQDDINDVNQHVGYMGRYYLNAHSCMALLPSRTNIWDHGKGPTLFKSGNDSVYTTQSLLTSAWYGRVWTLPEMVMSPRVYMTDDVTSFVSCNALLEAAYRLAGVRDAMHEGMRRVAMLLTTRGRELTFSRTMYLMEPRTATLPQDKVLAMKSLLFCHDLDARADEHEDEIMRKLILTVEQRGDHSWLYWTRGSNNRQPWACAMPRGNEKYAWLDLLDSYEPLALAGVTGAPVFLDQNTSRVVMPLKEIGFVVSTKRSNLTGPAALFENVYELFVASMGNSEVVRSAVECILGIKAVENALSQLNTGRTRKPSLLEITQLIEKDSRSSGSPWAIAWTRISSVFGGSICCATVRHSSQIRVLFTGKRPAIGSLVYCLGVANKDGISPAMVASSHGGILHRLDLGLTAAPTSSAGWRNYTVG